MLQDGMQVAGPRANKTLTFTEKPPRMAAENCASKNIKPGVVTSAFHATVALRLAEATFQEGHLASNHDRQRDRRVHIASYAIASLSSWQSRHCLSTIPDTPVAAVASRRPE
jgi:hypothetical protein